jgi:hypothetical protein
VSGVVGIKLEYPGIEATCQAEDATLLSSLPHIRAAGHPVEITALPNQPLRLSTTTEGVQIAEQILINAGHTLYSLIQIDCGI